MSKKKNQKSPKGTGARAPRNTNTELTESDLAAVAGGTEGGQNSITHRLPGTDARGVAKIDGFAFRQKVTP